MSMLSSSLWALEMLEKYHDGGVGALERRSKEECCSSEEMVVI